MRKPINRRNMVIVVGIWLLMFAAVLGIGQLTERGTAYYTVTGVAIYVIANVIEKRWFRVGGY